jgi:CubicO group peptidase (beta-lactamase class C family)
MDTETMETYLQQLAKSAGVNSISVSLSRQGERHSWTTAQQPGEPMRFQIGCVTKVIVAATTLELDACGELDIQSPIGKILDEFDGTEAGERIRVCHLLSDTAGQAGFPRFNGATDEFRSWDKLAAELAATPLIFSPGTVCSRDYSNQVLLGEIVRRVSGRVWTDLADETIGIPLFGRSLYVERDRQQLWSAAAASTMLSADELLSLSEVLMTGKSGTDSHCILSERTVSRLRETVIHAPELSGAFTRWFPGITTCETTCSTPCWPN